MDIVAVQPNQSFSVYALPPAAQEERELSILAQGASASSFVTHHVSDTEKRGSVTIGLTPNEPL